MKYFIAAFIIIISAQAWSQPKISYYTHPKHKGVHGRPLFNYPDDRPKSTIVTYTVEDMLRSRQQSFLQGLQKATFRRKLARQKVTNI